MSALRIFGKFSLHGSPILDGPLKFLLDSRRHDGQILKHFENFFRPLSGPTSARIKATWTTFFCSLMYNSFLHRYALYQTLGGANFATEQDEYVEIVHDLCIVQTKYKIALDAAV